jgi:hypothetical protein
MCAFLKFLEAGLSISEEGASVFGNLGLGYCANQEFIRWDLHSSQRSSVLGILGYG